MKLGVVVCAQWHRLVIADAHTHRPETQTHMVRLSRPTTDKTAYRADFREMRVRTRRSFVDANITLESFATAAMVCSCTNAG